MVGRQDHLHIRGEYTLTNNGNSMEIGSPPHTWRIRKWGELINTTVGITSTYVENTYLIKVGYFLVWDHLHIRGEYKTSASS